MISKQNLHAQVPTSLGQYLTLKGLEYEFTWQLASVAAGAKTYLRAQTSADKYTILNFRELKMNQELGFYRGFTVFTGGAPIDEIPIFNLRADTGVQSGATIETFSAPTTIDQTSKTIDYPLFGTPGQGNNPASGDVASDDAARIIPPGTTFILEFENLSADPCRFYANLKWYEVSPGFIPVSESV